MYGETLFFLFPEAQVRKVFCKVFSQVTDYAVIIGSQIYGGISMAIAALSILSLIAYSNSSYSKQFVHFICR